LRILGIVAVAALAAGALWLVRSGRLGAGAGRAARTLTLYGNVDIRQVELGFRVPGRLRSMLREEGQEVKAGELLAELDPVSARQELEAREAELALQEATLERTVAGSRPAEVARGKAAVEEATAAAKDARLELERSRQLLSTGATTRAGHDRAVAASLQAEARLASATESYRLLVQGSRKEDIDAARAAVRLAGARVASARTTLDDTRLLAPSDGVVISRVREPGAIVSPNDVVYVVSLTRSVWVRAYVSEPQLGLLRPGQEVAVLADSAPSRRVKGHVGFISPTAEFTPKSVETPELRTELVYRLRIIVDEPDAGLRQGMPVTVEIPLAASHG
jgi:HlyD family secretion protein